MKHITKQTEVNKIQRMRIHNASYKSGKYEKKNLDHRQIKTSQLLSFISGIKPH